MSENTAAPPETADPAAVSLALAGASREEADAFLRDQRHHIHEQLKQIHLDIFEKWLGVALRVATLSVGLAALASVIFIVWQASLATGTVVDAFSVPPQFAEEGITGEVVASDLTGRIAAIRDAAQSNSLDLSQNVRKDDPDAFRVEIPETGISLSQAWRLLRLWLGHEHHLTGNLRLLGNGKVALSVAINGQQSVKVEGPASDLDALEQKAAEMIFATVDPINIVIYLRLNGRGREGLAAAEHGVNIASTLPTRAIAYGLWAAMTRTETGDLSLAMARARLSTDIEPNLATSHREIMWELYLMGHVQDALDHARLVSQLREKDQQKTFRGLGFKEVMAQSAFIRNMAEGAFDRIAAQGDCITCPASQQYLTRAEFAARAHDGAASRLLLARVAAGPPFSTDLRAPWGAHPARARYFANVAVGDWSGAIAEARAFQAELQTDLKSPGMAAVKLRHQVPPMLALALAKSGSNAGAEAIITNTPGDCYDCIRARAVIAAAASHWRRADFWFARAAAMGPSIPFAYWDWGQSFLERGKPDAAIEKFELANRRGPHFADPLEGWGEALMAKNQSHLALAKFEAAETYAPNWGRLHLKWGEALVYAGKPAGAKAHFARAAELDLTPSEKSELARMKPHV